ncbi:MAG: RluA family pseudouridine synthase [Cyanobacteria bacterium J06626_18]
MNKGWTYRDRVPLTAAGQTLLDYYTQRYQHSSREDWQQRIEAGQITVEGKPSRPDQGLSVGQSLAYHRLPWQEPEVPLDFAVLYEDEDLMAIAKPAGLPVLPGGGFLEHTLLYQLQVRYPDTPPSPIHRLGRGTSGVMVLARSPAAKSDLSRQMRRSTLDPTRPPLLTKTYRALVGPSDLPATFVLTTPIGKVPYPVIGSIYAATPNGKPAYSEGRVLRRDATQTLLEVTIHTGRPHQIRIHLAAAGYPLVNDPLYAPGGLPYPVKSPLGELPMPGDCGYWLHAYRLQFIHPRTRKPLEILCPPPPILMAKSQGSWS